MNDFDEAYGDDPAVYGEPYPALLAHFEGQTPGRILDVGSGQGRNAIALAARGWHVTAIDRSVVGVRQSRRNGTSGAPRIDGIVADVSALPVRGRFEAVLADMVLHGLEVHDRGRTLDALREAVAPGGFAFVVVPERGTVLDEVLDVFADWGPSVAPIEHELASGEHAGVYEFISVVADRRDRR